MGIVHLSRKSKSKGKAQESKVKAPSFGDVSVEPRVFDPLTRPAPAGECAGLIFMPDLLAEYRLEP